jgi:predicted transcriptional regulator
MNVSELISLIDGNLLNKDANLNREVKGGCGADLMSDVLSSIKPEAVLFTGLCNPQVVRTAQMADVAAIVLVRGKIPPSETIELAKAEHIALISSRYGMFDLCGRLYQAGLPSFEASVSDPECGCEE